MTRGEEKIKIDDWRVKVAEAYCASMRNVACYMGTLLQDLWEIEGAKEGERFCELAEAGNFVKRLGENSLCLLRELEKNND